MAAILAQLGVQVDEKGKLAEGCEIKEGPLAIEENEKEELRQELMGWIATQVLNYSCFLFLFIFFCFEKGSSFWRFATLGIAFGSLLFVSAMSWKRIVQFLSERWTAPMVHVCDEEIVAGMAAAATAAAAVKATTEAATQTAASAAANVAAAASSEAAAASTVAQSAPAVPSIASHFSSPLTFTSHTVGPLIFTHSWSDGVGSSSAAGESTVHYINLTRFPRFLDFLSRISLQFVQMG